MPVDPRPIVDELATRAGAPGAAAAPALLAHLPEPHAPLAPVQGGEEVAALHRRWAEIHQPPGPVADAAGLAARVLTRLGIAAPASGAVQLDDRALVGDAIRALDAVARRVDELASRLAEVEAVVQDAVTVLSEDVTRALAATSLATAIRPTDAAGTGAATPPAPEGPGHGVAT